MRTFVGICATVFGIVMYETGADALGIVWIVMGVNMYTNKE